MDVFNRIKEEKLVPVIKLENHLNAVPLAESLAAGGIRVAEITFRTAAAAASIKSIRKECPGILVGAGTVLTLDQLEQAVEAGAEFIVAPGYNPVIVNACLKRQIPVIPGVTNPSQIEVAMYAGLGILKFFPAALSGGIPMLKTFGSVYSAEFMPTGGLNEVNFTDYLALPNVCACGGSWMVKPELINTGQFDKISQLSASAKSIINGSDN